MSRLPKSPERFKTQEDILKFILEVAHVAYLLESDEGYSSAEAFRTVVTKHKAEWEYLVRIFGITWPSHLFEGMLKNLKNGRIRLEQAKGVDVPSPE